MPESLPTSVQVSVRPSAELSGGAAISHHSASDFSLPLWMLFFYLFFAASAAAAPVLQQNATVLADGAGFHSGSISSRIKWQASGLLSKGDCSPSAEISSCFTATLNATGQRLPRNRQRIEALSWPPAEEGERWTYSWRYYLVPGARGSKHFFHIMQLLSRDISGFLIALSIYKDTVRIFDSLNDCEETKCPSLSLADFEGRTTRHHLEARFGPLGSVNYTVLDISTNRTLLEYRINGTIPASASVKAGLYRLIQQNQTEATADLGDFTFRKSK